VYESKVFVQDGVADLEARVNRPKDLLVAPLMSRPFLTPIL